MAGLPVLSSCGSGAQAPLRSMPGCALNEPENWPNAAGDCAKPANIKISSALCLIIPALSTCRSCQTSINGTNEVAGGSRTILGAPTGVVILRETGGLNLFERHALFDGVLNAVAYNRDHIAVLHCVELVADAAVARNNIRSAFLFVLGDRDIDDVVQSIDLALNTAAAFHVDERIAIGIEDVAGGYHVGAPKDNQAIAIGMRRGLPANFHRLLVKEDFLLTGYIGVSRPAPRRRRSLLAGRSAQPVQDIFVRD